MQPSQLIFLPGAGGNKTFWAPVSDLITQTYSRTFIEWPGIAGVKENENIKSIDDLANMVANKLDRPSAIIAQSMGGVVALLGALQRPERVTHIVLCATSGGIDVSDIQTEDWRGAYLDANPTYPKWFTHYHEDLTNRLCTLDMPVLLIWGDSDPISPIEIGERLAGKFANSHLEVIAGGDHSFANAFALDVAPLIERHIAQAS